MAGRKTTNPVEAKARDRCVLVLLVDKPGSCGRTRLTLCVDAGSWSAPVRTVSTTMSRPYASSPRRCTWTTSMRSTSRLGPRPTESSATLRCVLAWGVLSAQHLLPRFVTVALCDDVRTQSALVDYRVAMRLDPDNETYSKTVARLIDMQVCRPPVVIAASTAPQARWCVAGRSVYTGGCSPCRATFTWTPSRTSRQSTASLKPSPRIALWLGTGCIGALKVGGVA